MTTTVKVAKLSLSSEIADNPKTKEEPQKEQEQDQARKQEEAQEQEDGEWENKLHSLSISDKQQSNPQHSTPKRKKKGRGFRNETHGSLSPTQQREPFSSLRHQQQQSPSKNKSSKEEEGEGEGENQRGEEELEKTEQWETKKENVAAERPFDDNESSSESKEEDRKENTRTTATKSDDGPRDGSSSKVGLNRRGKGDDDGGKNDAKEVEEEEHMMDDDKVVEIEFPVRTRSADVRLFLHSHQCEIHFVDKERCIAVMDNVEEATKLIEFVDNDKECPYKARLLRYASSQSKEAYLSNQTNNNQKTTPQRHFQRDHNYHHHNHHNHHYRRNYNRHNNYQRNFSQNNPSANRRHHNNNNKYNFRYSPNQSHGNDRSHNHHPSPTTQRNTEQEDEERPQTTSVVARRLILGALDMRNAPQSEAAKRDQKTFNEAKRAAQLKKKKEEDDKTTTTQFQSRPLNANSVEFKPRHFST